MTPRQGDYAIAGVCVRLTLDENGICTIARVGLTNGGDTPIRSKGAEKVLEGTKIEEDTIENAIRNPDVWLQNSFNHLELLLSNAANK